jgi:hypothetical protein
VPISRSIAFETELRIQVSGLDAMKNHWSGTAAQRTDASACVIA